MSFYRMRRRRFPIASAEPEHPDFYATDAEDETEDDDGPDPEPREPEDRSDAAADAYERGIDRRFERLEE